METPIGLTNAHLKPELEPSPCTSATGCKLICYNCSLVHKCDYKKIKKNTHTKNAIVVEKLPLGGKTGI